MSFKYAQRRALPIVSACQRHYASVAASGVNISQLSIAPRCKIISSDEGSDASVLSIVLPAGSRAEKANELGVAHHLKNWAFRDTHARTALRITRETEICGGTLSTSLGREHLVYTAEFLRKDLPFFMSILAETVFGTQYQAFEAPKVHNLVAVETNRAFATPETIVNEALHKIAFRAGLGNSLYALPRNIDLSQIASFGSRASSNGSKIAVVGSGIDGAELEKVAASVFERNVGSIAQPPQDIPTQPSKYFGGEDRIDAATSEGHLAIAYPTGPSGSPTDFAAQVLKAHLGGDITTSYGVGVTPMAKVAALTPGADVKTFTYGYSDAGLFGVYIRSPSAEAKIVAKGALDEVKKAAENISGDDFKRAVARAKANALSAVECKVAYVESLGSQAVANTVLSTSDILAKLDAVTPADVSKLAASFKKVKPSVVAYGNTFALPYADSL